MDFKKTLLIACLFVGLNTFAQNRLEFNQVITIDSTISITTTFYNTTQSVHSNIYIVPAGKVWKIEYIVPFNYAFLINNRSLFNGYYKDNGTLWLKEGDEVKFKYSTSSTGSLTFFLSAIEFNIVQ
jgi:hypothetical protein